MNFLIIGGMLAIAILAILGAVFLGINEQRAEKSRAANGMISGSTSSLPAMEQTPTASRTAERAVPLTQKLPSTAERSLRSTGESQQHYALNGQFHELAAELRTLYQQAWELERRLRGLTELADHIEDTQSSRISIEEEAHSQSSADSTSA